MATVSYSDIQKLTILPNGTPTTQVVVRERTDFGRTYVKRHKPTGWIPPVAYFMNNLHRRGSHGKYGVKNPFGAGFLYEECVAGVGSSQWDVDTIANKSSFMVEVNGELQALQNMALIQARNNLKGSSVDLGTAFGERDQLARMLGDTAKRLATSVRELRRGRVRNAMRALGISSKRGEPRGSTWPKKWLELQYGWKPFLSDIYGAAAALSKRDRRDWRVTAKGRAKVVRFGTFSETGNNVHHYISSTKGEFFALVRIDAFLGEVSDLTSLGVTNPLLVAWELVPLSFVVDWLWPVGDWISSLDATLGVTIEGVSMTQFKRLETQGRGVTHDFAGTNYLNEWEILRKEVWLNRTVDQAVPLPSMPSLKNPASLGHMANALSLLAQAFS